MKICHITTVHARDDIRIFQKECTSLAKKFNVTLIVADGFKNEKNNGVNIINIGLRQKSRLKRIFIDSKKAFIKAKTLNCDIYHFHDPELFPIALKLKKLGKKIIFDSHESLSGQIMNKEYLPKKLRKFISFLVKKYYQTNIKKLDAVVSVTPHIVKEFDKNSNQVFLITNYPIVNQAYKKFTKDDYFSRKDVIFYAGTIYQISQQDIIIRAMENIKDIKYSLVGTIDYNYKNKLSKLNAWPRVSLTPYIPKVELDEIANHVTIGIVIFDYTPNWGNKMGSLGVNKIFEYMLYGLPIICTDFILWKEIIHNYNCGIAVNPNSVSDITKAIKYLTKNKEEAYEMGQNGREAVLKKFNWNTQEEVLFDIYDKILL